MKLRRFSSGDYSGRNPSWYWTTGLHDAIILKVEHLIFPMDYKNPDAPRNCLKLYLDASNALYDRNIDTILLLNYSVLSEESAIDGCYWMQDILQFQDGCYILDLILLGEDDFHFTVQFTDAQVHRK